MTGVEQQPDQAVGGDDRGEVDLERRDSEALGRGGQVHADQPGIAAQRRQPEADGLGQFRRQTAVMMIRAGLR